MRRWINTDVEIDLDEFTTEELVGELEHRANDGTAQALVLQVRTFVKDLQDAGCPMDILRQIEDWGCGPVPTRLSLERWMAMF